MCDLLNANDVHSNYFKVFLSLLLPARINGTAAEQASTAQKHPRMCAVNVQCQFAPHPATFHKQSALVDLNLIFLLRGSACQPSTPTHPLHTLILALAAIPVILLGFFFTKFLPQSLAVAAIRPGQQQGSPSRKQQATSQLKWRIIGFLGWEEKSNV